MRSCIEINVTQTVSLRNDFDNETQTNSLRYVLPTVISRMAGLDRDKRAAARGSNSVMSD